MRFLRWIFDLIISLISRKEPEPELQIPYPEEKPDYNNTLDNIDVNLLRGKFYDKYQVYKPDWCDTVEIILVPNLHCMVDNILLKVPAFSESENKRICIDPVWANPGVLAHEMAHVSYALLTDVGKTDFKTDYLTCDHPLLKLLDDTNDYMNTNIVEAHAEIYRYLGTFMPEELKQYYPKLLD